METRYKHQRYLLIVFSRNPVDRRITGDSFCDGEDLAGYTLFETSLECLLGSSDANVASHGILVSASTSAEFPVSWPLYTIKRLENGLEIVFGDIDRTATDRSIVTRIVPSSDVVDDVNPLGRTVRGE